MNDFENETSAFVTLGGKFHQSSPQSDRMADFTFRFGLATISMENMVLQKIKRGLIPKKFKPC
jgi:hypothetical protein